MTNIWDGTPTPILAVWKSPTSDKYIDYTTTVAEQDNVKVYIAGVWVSNPTLAMKLSNFKADDRMYFGSAARLAGLQVTMSQDDRNRRSAIIRVEYFNGTTWVSCSDIRDGTSHEGKSLWQSGTITWTPPDPSVEFKTCVNNDMELYYYRVYWSTYLSTSDVWVDKIVGVPMPVQLTGSTSAFVAQDRLFLVKGNTLECSPMSRPSVINGSEHVAFTLGDEGPITGGCHLFSIQGSEYYSPILVFKKTATFLLTGAGPDWKRHELSRYDGLAAPDTLVVVNLPISIPGFGTTVAIGQGATGIFISDGRPPRIVSKDIEHYFDPRHEDAIQPENLDKSVGFMDYDHLEYHWLFVSGTSETRKEMVLNLHTMEWFEIDRGNHPLEFGFSVMDAWRKQYTYGTCSDAYVKRLEYGTSFDGDPIVCAMWPGDVALAGDPTIETKCEHVQILCVAKEVSCEKVSYDHYLDTNVTAMDRDITMAPVADGKRIANMIATVKSPYAVFHSGKVVFCCDDENIAFEPLAWMYHYEIEHQRVKPNQADEASSRSWLYTKEITMRRKYSATVRDRHGNIVAGASVSVFLAGATTPASIYTTLTGATAVSGTVSDEAGRYIFYVDTFDYDVDQTFKIVCSKGTMTALTLDNVYIEDIVLGEYTITENRTVTTNVSPPRGVTYNVAAGVTLTFSGSFSAGLYQVFTGDGGWRGVGGEHGGRGWTEGWGGGR